MRPTKQQAIYGLSNLIAREVEAHLAAMLPDGWSGEVIRWLTCAAVCPKLLTDEAYCEWLRQAESADVRKIGESPAPLRAARKKNPDALIHIHARLARETLLRCLAECPDPAVEAMRFARERLAWHQQQRDTQAGAVREHLLAHSAIWRRGKMVARIRDLSDSELAAYLMRSRKGFKLDKDSVKKARQSLSEG